MTKSSSPPINRPARANSITSCSILANISSDAVSVSKRAPTPNHYYLTMTVLFMEDPHNNRFFWSLVTSLLRFFAMGQGVFDPSGISFYRQGDALFPTARGLVR